VTAYVLDASVAMAWCFKDEGTLASDRLLEQLEREAAAVPTLWHVEIANVLAVGERRHRITPARSAQFVGMLDGLGIAVDEEMPTRAWRQILDLARSEQLTAYDAAYLELAMRLGIPLATKDDDLGKAAERLGVRVLWAN
jgi:predicted nucleic acid-binding protein